MLDARHPWAMQTAKGCNSHVRLLSSPTLHLGGNSHLHMKPTIFERRPRPRSRRLYVLLGIVILATLPCYCAEAILIALKTPLQPTATPSPMQTSTMVPATLTPTGTRLPSATPSPTSTLGTPFLTPTNTLTRTPLPSATPTQTPSTTPPPSDTPLPPSDTPEPSPTS